MPTKKNPIKEKVNLQPNTVMKFVVIKFMAIPSYEPTDKKPTAVAAT